jgi:DNA-binding NarL/FixJ family response regulator
MKVLLVEDQRELCDEIQRVLHAQPDVRIIQACATSGEALSWLARYMDAWDLALVDIFLQEGNGFDVLRACAMRSRHQKVAVLSNYTREPLRQYLRQAGADAFFDKSMELDALLAYCLSQAEVCRARARASLNGRALDFGPTGERR